MNRTEANAIAASVEELNLLEQLQTILTGHVTGATIDIDTEHGGKVARINTGNLFGRHLASVVTALQSSVGNRIVDLKAELGITDEPATAEAPIAAETTAPTEAPASDPEPAAEAAGEGSIDAPAPEAAAA